MVGVVENHEDLPFLIHCSWFLTHLQKDCIFEIGGQHADLPSRKFRVTELTSDIQCPDHIVCQIVPCYDKQTVGYTQKEVEKKYSTSNHYLKKNTDYHGNYISEQPGDR